VLNKSLFLWPSAKCFCFYCSIKVKYKFGAEAGFATQALSLSNPTSTGNQQGLGRGSTLLEAGTVEEVKTVLGGSKVETGRTEMKERT
jgi:hypothetical protein